MLALDNLSFFDAGDYDVIVSNVAGATTSHVATVSLSVSPPINLSVRLDPTNGVAFLGGNVVLTAHAQGTPPLSYRWSCENQPLFDARDPILRLDHVTFADSGNYAAAVAKRLDTEHHEQRFTEKELLELVPKLPSIYGEPFGDP